MKLVEMFGSTTNMMTPMMADITLPKRQIDITVRGFTGCGTTTLAEELDAFLIQQGYDCELVRLFPYEHGPHREVTFDQRVEHIKSNVNIVITEGQKSRQEYNYDQTKG